jgi:hypothetical protein
MNRLSPTAALTGAGLTIERVEWAPNAGGQPPALPSQHQRHQLHGQLYPSMRELPPIIQP